MRELEASKIVSIMDMIAWRLISAEASKIVSIMDMIAWRLISADSEETLESALFEWR